MSLYYSPIDKTLVDKAREKLRTMLFKQCFMERWSPIQLETAWVLHGRPNEKHHKKLLPDYCYNILELHRRTIYKEFSPIAEVLTIKNKKRAHKAKKIADAKKYLSINWDKVGAVFRIGERSMTFYEQELEKELKKGGLLRPKKKQALELYQMLFGKDWIERKLAEIQATDPNKPLEKIIDDKFAQLERVRDNLIPEWHKKAREWSPEAVTNYYTGVVRGSDGFIDNFGALTGEKKIKLRNTYEFLLLSWPEIAEMIKDKTKTRNHLWERLRPFSHARWIEIQDLEQLNRLCNEIKLKLKKPGAPRKTK
jgi:hypothetical protein